MNTTWRIRRRSSGIVVDVQLLSIELVVGGVVDLAVLPSGQLRDGHDDGAGWQPGEHVR